jgi:hypothetical protein
MFIGKLALRRFSVPVDLDLVPTEGRILIATLRITQPCSEMFLLRKLNTEDPRGRGRHTLD